MPVTRRREGAKKVGPRGGAQTRRRRCALGDARRVSGFDRSAVGAMKAASRQALFSVSPRRRAIRLSSLRALAASHEPIEVAR